MDRLLRRIKGYLWNGNLHGGRSAVTELVLDLEGIETDYPGMMALRKAAGEFDIYIRNNAGMIPNYADLATTDSHSVPTVSDQARPSENAQRVKTVKETSRATCRNFNENKIDITTPCGNLEPITSDLPYRTSTTMLALEPVPPRCFHDCV